MNTQFKMPEPFGAIQNSHLEAGMAIAPVPIRPAWWYGVDSECTMVYTSSHMRAVIEQCTQICNSYSVDRRALYKGRPPYKGNEPGRADQYTDGQSDGADHCEEEIRKLLEQVK